MKYESNFNHAGQRVDVPVEEKKMKESDWEHPHTFEEAVDYLKQGHHIDYEVTVGGHRGALIHRNDWIEAVSSRFFIDYDGYGDQLTADGKFIGGNIYPSQAGNILPQTAYILWYNR